MVSRGSANSAGYERRTSPDLSSSPFRHPQDAPSVLPAAKSVDISPESFQETSFVGRCVGAKGSDNFRDYVVL